jgi:MoCo/4Fe-4S cofactor protein with predicted Tat translocation signal
MQSTGKRFWRSLEELADTRRFREMMEREFPDQAAEWTNPITRRRFLTLLGASFALAGIGGCNTHPPEDKILPYVHQPEGMVLGKPLFFATSMTLTGRAVGLLVESNEGRPTKIEGNPQHPASLGATDAFAQASVLTLYDPDRSQAVLYRGQPRAYAELVTSMREEMVRRRQNKGAGFHILTEIVSSPTLAKQLQKLQNDLPKTKWHQFEPAAPDNAFEGSRLAFGAPVDLLYHFEKADVVLSLDADFLTCGPAHLPNVRAFAARRRIEPGRPEMNRLYVVEPTPTATGMKADDRLRLRASQVETFARVLAGELGLGAFASLDALPPEARTWIKPLAEDLQKHAGSCIILAGDGQPPAVHALAHATNHRLGNYGKTAVAIDSVDARTVNRLESLKELIQDIDAGDVQTLLILGGNPVYNAPVDLRFAERLQKVPLRIHLSLYHDETSQLCQWHVPEAHYLEAWGDARAFDGAASIVQPLIAPLYNGKSAYEALADWTEPAQRSGHDLVRDHWRAWWSEHPDGKDFEHFWRRALHAGLIKNSQSPPKEVKFQTDWAARAGLQNDAKGPQIGVDSLEVIFRPDPTIYDGRFANNGWLQELPKPVTKLTWDNAVLLSPATAKSLGIGYAVPGNRGGEHGEAVTDLVELRYHDKVVKAPVLVVPGHADGAATVHLGYGRTKAGRVGNDAGFNAYLLRMSEKPYFDSGLTLRKTGERFALACTQTHYPIDHQGKAALERGILHVGKLSDYRQDPHSIIHERHERTSLPTLLNPEEFPYDKGYQWGMVIDLGACVGCNACVVACQAENNIPIVGKLEVTHGREMHWIRIDRYYEGSEDDPRAYFQPVPCMHCENAPCELVCPVAATTHSLDGLNEMTYNRCVGTRYCSNNCPYKVRRFNFLQYADYAKGSLNLLNNPDVTVRSRGVMEKCTYCVQRIREAEINAKNQNNRPIHDGEVVTACQAACPAEAIVFGNLNDKKSRVSKRKAESEEAALHYGMLEELNTRPRTTYIAALRNPKFETS